MKRRASIFVPVLLSVLSLFFWVAPSLAAAQSPAPNGANVYLIAPTDGQMVTSPLKVQFGLSGMGIAPAGVERDNTGHHHLLVDMAELPALNEPLQASEQLKHFGAGQTETELSLPPGEHTLQLVLGNASHVPHNPPVLSEQITINVRS